MPRTTQHRPSRDSHKARELADLRKANHRLEAEVQRLREGPGRAPGSRKGRHEKETVSTGPTGICPNCGAATRLVDLVRMKVWACPECKGHQPA